MAICATLLFAVACMSAGSGVPGGPSRRRKLGDGASDAGEVELTEMQSQSKSWLAAVQPISSGGGTIYDMDNEQDKQRLASDIWTEPFAGSLMAFREANPELVCILSSCISNQSKVTATLVENKERLVDGVLLNIVRAQSQKKMPLLTVALSLLAEANHVTREFHDVISLFFKGALTSETWAEEFMAKAREMRPQPTDLMLMGVVVACFDNLTMNVDYSSYVREGESGYKLDMTNWFSTPIPRFLVCTQFDAKQICENWPSSFEHTCLAGLAPQWLACLQYPLSTFPAPHSPQSRRVSSARTSRSPRSAVYFIPTTLILLPINQRTRWERFLRAARNGRLLDRPNVLPRWRPHKTYQPPMFGRLQSSYDDVEYEITEITKACSDQHILFLAGDGLALMRLNHLLALKPDQYIDQTPVVIPVQGSCASPQDCGGPQLTVCPCVPARC